MKKKYLIISFVVFLQCTIASENRLNHSFLFERGNVAILSQFQKHIFGTPSSPDTIATILTDAGFNVEFITPEELGDSTFLTPNRFDIVVLPYGQSFPLIAHKSFVKYLHNGGNFISMGGYAFTDLLKYEEGKWVKDSIYGNNNPMNSAKGIPRNELNLRPDQIGIFDASFPLRRTAALKTSPIQSIIKNEIYLKDRYTGWAATGVVGDISNAGIPISEMKIQTNARLVPLVETFDQYGRPRGAAGSVMLHFNGYFKKSNWAFFGVENIDLFENSHSDMAKALCDVSTFLANKLFLGEISSLNRLYKAGEEVKVKAVIINRGIEPRQVKLKFAWASEGKNLQKYTVETSETIQPGEEKNITVSLGSQPKQGDLWKIRGVLFYKDQPLDEITTGYVNEKQEVYSSSAKLIYKDNYFTRDGRPTFLFGNDESSYIYQMPHENPLTWSNIILAARDIGMTIMENLNYNRDQYQSTEWDWRNFEAMNQIIQKHNMVYMTGLILLRNITIGDSTLLKQTKISEGFAKRFSKSPGIIYYLNGDYPVFEPVEPEETKKLWNNWLKEQYGSLDNLMKSWETVEIKDQWGDLGFRRPRISSQSQVKWDDRATIDTARFVNWIINRWNKTHTNSIEKFDKEHAKISEFYGGGHASNLLDGRAVGGDLDIHNFVSFSPIESFRQSLCWFDMRLQEKGLGVGEYGSRLHPAWTGEGGPEYDRVDILDSEVRQKQIYSNVAHYALGLGASHIQNWCLRDAQGRQPHPWGIFHAETVIPKETAYMHRNLALLFRYFNPKYKIPELAVCLPYNMRVGKYHFEAGMQPAYKSFEALLNLHHEFGVIDDNKLQHLTNKTKFIMYPSPFTLTDETYERLLEWVKNGGILFVTGDISYDENRKFTRSSRLQELCGVSIIQRNYSDIDRQGGKEIHVDFTSLNIPSLSLRPCVNVKVEGAEVLGKSKNGDVVLTKQSLGNGCVYFLTDPIELSNEEFIIDKVGLIYRGILNNAKIESFPVTPDEPWVHAMKQPTESGLIHVVFNDKEGIGSDLIQIPISENKKIKLNVRNKWPGMAAVTNDAKVVAINFDGLAEIDGDPLSTGNGMKAIVSIDGNDIRQSDAFLVLPFETGDIVLPNIKPGMTGILGDFVKGEWVEFEQYKHKSGKIEYDFDSVNATCILLVCKSDEVRKWTEYLNLSMQHPEKIMGM